MESSNEEANTRNDLIAGWLGGAVGILVSNPLEVLKVRLQTSRHSPSAAASSPPATSRVGAGSRSSTSPLPVSTSLNSTSTSLKPTPTLFNQGTIANAVVKPGLGTLWKAEGLRFLFAGAAGPILGLAFIDSAFFGGYGVAMQTFGQDRQDPTMLSRVFLAGAASGASCALLQTPIEVVKCRAQAESIGVDGKKTKMGSFKIAQKIAKKDGLRGFYIGGLMTACRDGISSGIFFWGYFVFRRLLRGQEPFQPSSRSSLPGTEGTKDMPTLPPISEMVTEGKINKAEVARILLAGGMAGSLSAVVPYPFDIIKTRLQTSTIESRAHPILTPALFTTSLTSSPATTLPSTIAPLTVRQVFHGIHADGMASSQHGYQSSFLYSFLARHVFAPRSKSGLKGFPSHNTVAAEWTVRILGMKGFLRGIKPTVASSFVGSAVTITTFEMALLFISDSPVGSG